MRSSRNPQLADPLGAVATWAVIPVSVVIILGYVGYSTLTTIDQISNPGFLAVSLVLVTIACLAFVWRSRPRRAPFSRFWFLGILGLAVLADLSYVAATWGLNQLVQDDWGQVAVAVLLLASARLRPPRELAATGLIGAVVLGAVASLQWSFLTVHSNPVLYAVVVGTPILALAVGGAAYGSEIVRSAEQWRTSATDAMDRLRPENRATAARTVQQEQVTDLNSRAVPLLEDVLRGDRITEAHRADAAAIAAELRSRAVGALEQGWLGEALVRAGQAAGDDLAGALDDPEDLAKAMTIDQRAVVRAVIVTLSRRAEVRLGSVAVRIRRADDPAPPGRARGGAWFELAADLDGAGSHVRRALSPYRNVLRAVAWRAELVDLPGRVTLGFWYECA